MKKLVVQNLLKVWLCAMVSFMTVTLYAQGNSFKVSGTVKDNTGELVIVRGEKRCVSKFGRSENI